MNDTLGTVKHFINYKNSFPLGKAYLFSPLCVTPVLERKFYCSKYFSQELKALFSD